MAEQREQRGFILRIKPSGIDRVDEALQANELIIGWAKAAGLLDESLDWPNFRQIVHDHYHSDESNYRGSGRDAGDLWRFVRDMGIGDIVVVPHGSNFYVAEVSGLVRYDIENVSKDSAYRRPVRWLNGKSPIPRKYARSLLLSRMKCWNTCVWAGDILDDIKDVLGVAESGEEPTFEDGLYRGLVGKALDELLHGRMGERKFEEYLQDVLYMLGAKKVRLISNRQEDKGADLLATFEVAGTFDFVLAVQAKYWRPDRPVQPKAIDQLVAGMEAESADIGWFVTSGEFSSEVTDYVEEIKQTSGMRIELVDGDHLAKMIVENGVNREAGSK